MLFENLGREDRKMRTLLNTFALLLSNYPDTPEKQRFIDVFCKACAITKDEFDDERFRQASQYDENLAIVMQQQNQAQKPVQNQPQKQKKQ